MKDLLTAPGQATIIKKIISDGFPSVPSGIANTRNDYRLTDVINLAKKNDAIYFADTYGVFSNDWYRSILRAGNQENYMVD